MKINKDGFAENNNAAKNIFLTIDEHLGTIICLLIVLCPSISFITFKILETNIVNNEIIENILTVIFYVLGILPLLIMGIISASINQIIDNMNLDINIWHIFSLIAIIISFRKLQKREIKIWLFLLIVIANVAWMPLWLDFFVAQI